MRLLLTAVSAGDGRSVDLAVECEDDARVRDVAESLGSRLEVVTTAATHGALGLVGGSAGPGPAPSLFLGAERLDPELAVAASGLRHGVLVGVGGPLPDLLAEPGGVIELRVSSGPGAGTVRRLGVGTHAVGRDPGCAMVVDDPAVPEVALRVDVSPDGTVVLRPDPSAVGVVVETPQRALPLQGPVVVARRGEDAAPVVAAPKKRRRRRRRKVDGDALANVEIDHRSIDPSEARALLELDRLPLDRDEVWDVGVALTVGPVVLDLAPVTPADASLSPSPGGATLDYNRPPRLSPEPRVTEFSLPRVPTRPEKQSFPFLMLVAPIVMGAVMYLITRRVYTLLFLAMSPLMVIANFSQGRRGMKKRFESQTKDFEEKTVAIERAAFEALVAERTARRRDVPDPAEVLLIATGPRSRLWERRRTDGDWLVVRVGTADVASEVVLRDPQRESHEGPLSWTAPDVPVTVRLEDVGVTGLAGPGDAPHAMARWALAQVAALHSPAELEIVVLSDGSAQEQWQWVRWLPHLRADADSGVLSRVGTDDESTARRVAELVRELEARKEAAQAQQAVRITPMLVVLDGARRLRLLNGMVALLREGPSVGISFLCLDSDARLLPEECKAVVTAGPTGRLTVERSGARTVEAIRADVVPVAWCERVARALAPVRDVSQLDAAASLPTSSRLLSVLRLDPPTGAGLAAGWARQGRSTAAIIGEGAEGPFEIDIRRDGPHGLVAGTTGSGKSELLQTLIASLAVRNRPDEMTFVLVDYKGGAAFKDCNRLPHTVGMVTDLDGHLTTRALVSLGAELRRREHQLAAADAKDIEDYLAARQVGDEPMPRLMIVIDEFAALVAELPDFVAGLVDIARRGRSLGVHLILATQRPAGVVSAEIKSNTNLRIALRVTDTGDSQDVIESKEAAHISKSTPGRGYARLGFSALTPFQSARVGGRPRGADDGAAVALRDVAWASLGSTALSGKRTDEEGDISVLTDLSTVVAALQEAAEIAEVPQVPSPWLPALPEAIWLEDLEQPEPDAEIPPLLLGLADLPAAQRQEPMTWDLVRGGHLAVGGQARSGRSTVLRLIAAGIARTTSSRDVHVYALDFGNNALLPLLAMPHVGAVVSRDQQDRLRRVLALLGSEVTRRQQLLAEKGFADIAEQRAAAEPDARLPYLVVLLDRWEGFVAAYESVDGGAFIERMQQLLREGAGVGLRMVMTGDRTIVAGRMSTLVEDRLLLRMPSPEDYALIGMRAKEVPTSMPAGRAFRGEETVREVQLALLDPDPAGTAQVAALQRHAAEAAVREPEVPAALRPRRVDDLPVAITLEDALALEERVLAPTELLVGVGGDTLALRTLDVLADGQGLLVVGPPRAGRSSTLLTVALDAKDRGWTLLVLTPRRSPLRDLPEGRKITQLTDATTPDELKAALSAARSPKMVVVDDFEVMGADHPLSAVLEEYLKSIRDAPDALVMACGIDEVTTYYRGPTAAMRKSRTGLVLAPRSAADGEPFSARLPRSVGGAAPQGRGVLVRSSGWEWVQVPRPPLEL